MQKMELMTMPSILRFKNWSRGPVAGAKNIFVTFQTPVVPVSPHFSFCRILECSLDFGLFKFSAEFPIFLKFSVEHCSQLIRDI